MAGRQYGHQYQYPPHMNNYKTTYGTSYKDVPTLEVSPVYDQLREGGMSPRRYEEDHMAQRNGFDKGDEYYWSPRHNDIAYTDSPRGREMYQDGREDPRYNRPRDQFREQLARDEPVPHPYDSRAIFCHKCFKNKLCVNRLSCNHQFCDDCMRSLSGSDNPFRDSIRWHYKCNRCDPPTYTSEMKLIRLNPYGQRLLKNSGVRYFDPEEEQEAHHY